MTIIPRPLQHDPVPGELRLDQPFWFGASGTSEEQREALGRHSRVFEEILSSVGIAPGAAGSACTLTFSFDEAAGPKDSDHPERYTVRVAPESVVISAPSVAGLWNGTQSLVQLAHLGADGVSSLPCGLVVDEPRFPWRGFSLDIARHFFGPTDLRRVVDLISRYKLNVLHLHVTDDQGWRLDLPSRPELAALSSDSDCSGGPGGFLTAGEFRDLQAYAEERFVTVVPEIDVPGHTNAATHAYGDLCPDGGATEVYRGVEVGFSTLHLDLPATEPFLRDVLTDVANMTVGPYLHFGGDEALATNKAEYVAFIELCEKIVREAGKIPVAWNEAAAASLSPGTLLQFWDTNRSDVTTLRRAATLGARLIMSPGRHTYLDMKYTPDYPLGQEWAGLIELRDAYDWDPATLIEGLDPASIEGVEAAIWTETLATFDDVLDMVLPRLTATAEVAWTAPSRKSWGDYRERVALEAEREWQSTGTPFHRTAQVDWVE